MNEPRDKPSFASLFNRARGDSAPPPEAEATPAPAESPAAEAPARDEWAYEAMQFLVDPARVRIWAGNARSYEDLDPENCDDLIGSIASEGMQKVAAIVRPVFDDAVHEYEVIAGTRRHFAVSYLRATTMPSLRFLVQVEILDDEAAFRLADIENRARRGVSDIESARNYAAALNLHYDGHLARMAERLSLTKPWLTKMIRIADIPDPVVAAFPSPADLDLETAHALAQALDAEDGPAILATATQIARAQAGRRADGLSPYSTAEVLQQLLGAPEPEDEEPQVVSTPDEQPADDTAEMLGPTGRLGINASVNSESFTLTIHAGSGVTRADIDFAVHAMLNAAESKGFSLDLPSEPETGD